MSAIMSGLARPLAVRVKEPTMGLFYWVVTELASREHEADRRVDASDHPYPTHEAALLAGHACLKVIRSAI